MVRTAPGLLSRAQRLGCPFRAGLKHGRGSTVPPRRTPYLPGSRVRCERAWCQCHALKTLSVGWCTEFLHRFHAIGLGFSPRSTRWQECLTATPPKPRWECFWGITAAPPKNKTITWGYAFAIQRPPLAGFGGDWQTQPLDEAVRIPMRSREPKIFS